MVNNKKKKNRRHKRPIPKEMCARCSQSSINLDSTELNKLETLAINGATQSEEANQSEQLTDKKPKEILDFTDSKAVESGSEEEKTEKTRVFGDDDSSIEYNPDLAIPVVVSDTDRYDMSRAKNGCGIIFNFEDFQDHKKYKKREGSQADVDRLLKVFQELDVDISDRVHKNMTYNSMRERLREFLLKKPLLLDSNAIIVVILSHGLEGDMIMASDRQFHLYELMKLFTPEELPEMATRPKIFIIQACRGEEIDSGSILINQSIPTKFTFDQIDSASDETPFKYPSHADLCIALSSHHGHNSFRNSEGSWFIQSFCNVIETIDLKNNHLLDIFTATNRIVATRSSKSEDVRLDDKKQISSVYHTLTQKYYFKTEK